MNYSRIIVLDFGSQTTQLIARKVRELGVFAAVLPCDTSVEKIKEFSPNALIFSGGPASVSAQHSPKIPPELLTLDLPVLGICYGFQSLVHALGGQVGIAEEKEFGPKQLNKVAESTILNGLSDAETVWMSHGDQIESLPEGFQTILATDTCPHAAVACEEKSIYGVQFHPEVAHTPCGIKLISNFLFDIAKLQPNWQPKSFLEEKVASIRAQVGEGHVLMGLSGGVDSTVAATLIHRAIGKQLTCVYVDHGLHRTGEIEEIERLFQEVYHIDLRIVQAREQFMAALKDVTDPELKRKIIGHVFIDVFECEARALGDVHFLGQGTLYPDVIESVSFHGGPSDVIKSHHNVGGLPEKMNLKLVEPLRDLFKDEVRALGTALGLPQSLLLRQPFPGPGLAIRILGEVSPGRCEILRHADHIVREEVESCPEIEKPVNLWQWFAVLLPVCSVGVMGDSRSYGETICVRCVESVDAMTADWSYLSKSTLNTISTRIMNEVQGISRVVYDISPKPPSTIEWE